MKKLLASSTLAVAALMASVLCGAATSSHAARSQDELRQFAAKMAEGLAQACPHSAQSDISAFQSCAMALSQWTDIPFALTVLWGGDQANQRIKNRKLTRLTAQLFRSTYLPLLTFTGQFSIERDDKEKVDIIKVEAYFRNALPAGEYPSPFWHTAENWEALETLNVIKFYVDDKGRIIHVTQSAGGSDANRGAYAHVTPPIFVKDQWTWTDATGQRQPRVMQFSARYQAANPSLPRLDSAYREFTESMQGASCVECHNPANTPGARQLILLHSPLHVIGEIRRVIKSVQGAEMPQDEIGMPKEIDAKLRDAILRSAVALRDELAAADTWEAERQVRTARAPAPPPSVQQPSTR